MLTIKGTVSREREREVKDLPADTNADPMLG